MKKLKIILALILCLTMISIFFVGCEKQDEFIEAESTISPYTEFSSVGATLNTIELKDDGVLLHYTYTFKVIKEKEETLEEVNKKLNDKVDSLNKRVVAEKKYNSGKRAFGMEIGDTRTESQVNDKNEAITKTKIDFVVSSKYLSNISSTYVKRMPLADYLKNYDINKDTYIDSNGAKIDLSKISKMDKCYYVKIYNTRDNITFVVDGKIISAKQESAIKESLNKDSTLLVKDTTELVYMQKDNTLLWILLPITIVIVAALVVVLILKFCIKKDKKGAR